MKRYIRLNIDGHNVKLSYIDEVFNLYRIEVDGIFVGTFRVKDFIHIYKNNVENNEEENEKINQFYKLIYSNTTKIVKKILGMKYLARVELTKDGELYDFKFVEAEDEIAFGLGEQFPNVYAINGTSTYYVFFNDVIELITDIMANKLKVGYENFNMLVKNIEEKFGKGYVLKLILMLPEGFV
jgi:hypothetical protein